MTSALRLIEDAKAVEKAGCFSIILEAVPARVGKLVADSVAIPVIGIGAGSECDGQVLVLYDMLGITPGKPPRFVKDFLEGADSIADAVGAYVKAVQDGSFPGPEHSFK